MTDTDTTQLIYASKARFGSDLSAPSTQRTLMRIVRESRNNNPAADIGGVLHFGNGYFLQILEGPAEAVDRLFARIEADDRHGEVKILRHKTVAEPTFGQWRMKFLTLERDVNELIKRHGMTSFRPHELDAAMLDDLIGVLLAAEDEAA